MVNERTEFDIFIGTRIGSFKHVKYFTDTTKNTKKHAENLQDINTLTKEDTITSMCWGNKEQTEILVGRQNKEIQVYNTVEKSFVKTLTADFADGDVVGLGKYKRRIIAAMSSGVVKIWSKKKEKEVVLQTGGELDRLRCCSEDDTLFGTGGQENDLKVWRVGEAAPTFTAKNVAHDWLELRQPVWVSDLCFLPSSGGQVLATCSRHGYVRLYDCRAQRRPVCNVEFKGMAATCMAPSFDDKLVMVGFGRGQLHQVDLRSKGRPDKGYKGSVGAVTDLALASPRYVVSVSLDRHVKVHDYVTKEMLYKQYLTSKLSCVLAQTESSTPLKKLDCQTELKSEEEVEVKEEDEMDLIFENMDTIGDKSRKNKLKGERETPVKKTKLQTTDESIVVNEQNDKEDAIVKLLKSTEKKKRKMERKKKEKRAKSVFYQA